LGSGRKDARRVYDCAERWHGAVWKFGAAKRPRPSRSRYLADVRDGAVPKAPFRDLIQAAVFDALIQMEATPSVAVRLSAKYVEPVMVERARWRQGAEFLGANSRDIEALAMIRGFVTKRSDPFTVAREAYRFVYERNATVASHSPSSSTDTAA
jgi:hypothetical protein